MINAKFNGVPVIVDVSLIQEGPITLSAWLSMKKETGEELLEKIQVMCEYVSEVDPETLLSERMKTLTFFSDVSINKEEVATEEDAPKITKTTTKRKSKKNSA